MCGNRTHCVFLCPKVKDQMPMSQKYPHQINPITELLAGGRTPRENAQAWKVLSTCAGDCGNDKWLLHPVGPY